jgi:preprotein translocase subunit SecF
MKLHVIKQRVFWWRHLRPGIILVGIGAMALSWQQFGAPLKPGLDFAGGTRLQLTRVCAIEANCARRN